MGVFQSAAHDGAVHHADAIVTNTYGASVTQLRHFGEVVPLLAERDGADGMKAWPTNLCGARTAVVVVSK